MLCPFEDAMSMQRIIACTQQQCNHGLTNSKRWQLLLFFFLVFRLLLWLCCFSFGMPFGLHLLLDLRWQLLRSDEATSDGATRVFVRVPCFFLVFRLLFGWVLLGQRWFHHKLGCSLSQTMKYKRVWPMNYLHSMKDNYARMMIICIGHL